MKGNFIFWPANVPIEKSCTYTLEYLISFALFASFVVEALTQMNAAV